MTKKIEKIQILNRGFNKGIPVVQLDTGRGVEFYIQDYTLPENAQACIYVVKPSGKVVYNRCAVSDNAVSVKLTNQMLAEVGKAPFQIEILNGNEIITSFAGYFAIDKRLKNDTAIESADEFGALVELNEEIQSALTDTVAELKDTFETTVKEVSTTLDNTVSTVNNKLQETEGKINTTVNEVNTTLDNTVSTVNNKLRETEGKINTTVQEAVADFEQTAAETLQESQRQINEAKEEVQGTLNDVTALKRNTAVYQDSGTALARAISITGVTSWEDVLNTPIRVKTSMAGVASTTSFTVNNLSAKTVYFYNLDSTGVTTTPPVDWVRAGQIYEVMWDGMRLMVVSSATASNTLSIDSMPVGFSMDWWSDTLPSGKWMFGNTVIPAGYTQARAVFGTSTPNTLGKVVVDRSTADTEFDTLKKTGGEKSIVLLDKNMPGRVVVRLYVENEVRSAQYDTGYYSQWTNTALDDITGKNPSIQSKVPFSNLQPYIVARKIFKVL